MKGYTNRSDLLLYSVFSLCKFYILISAILFTIRLAFVAYFGDSGLVDKYSSDLFHAFYLGWKYDNLVACYLIVPLFLVTILTFLVGRVSVYNFFQFLFRPYAVFAALLVTVISISDLGFYSYFQDHINILIFGVLEDDTRALFETIWKNYPVGSILLGLGVYFIFVVYISKRVFRSLYRGQTFLKANKLFNVVLILTSFTLLAGGVRGGYGKFVIARKYSDFSDNEFINQVAVNGVVALEKAIKLRRTRTRLDFNMASVMGYDKNIHAAFSDYLGVDTSPTPRDQLLKLIYRRTTKNKHLEKVKPNVVVLVMESFGGSWIKYNSSEFDFMDGLLGHFKEDYYFPNFISADNGTIGSLLTIGTNIPHRQGARFLSESRYMYLALESSAHIPYKNKGYETNFIYGGKLGWRDIGKYFKRQGYHHVTGEIGIKNDLGLEGRVGTEWGIYDEYLFDYILKNLKERKHSQFFMALSTSNHPPFEFPNSFPKKKLRLPDSLKNRIAREEELFLKRFQTFQYVSTKLSEFLDNIKNSSLADNTIVVITGDHNFWGFMNYTKEESYEKFTVPFYLYVPAKIFSEKVNLNKVGSHEDIMSTLYNISLSDTEYLSFGEDLLSDNKTYALNNAIHAGEEGVVYRGKKYEWSKMPLIKTQDIEKEFTSLDLRYRSSLSIADFYLREKLKASKKSRAKK